LFLINPRASSPNASPIASQGVGPRPFARTDFLPLGVLVASHVALFWKVLFTPAMFFYRDVFAYSYPHARFIREACRAGYLPYWNPLLNYGEPVLANPNFLFFYPSTLLLVALPLDLAYTLHYALHFMLAAVGAYGLARRWGQTRWAAFLAGFVFSFSGPVLSLGNLYNHAAAAAWIPWAMLLTDLALEGRSRRPWILLTLVFAFQFLAAEPFTLLATFVLCLAFALYQAGELGRHLARENLRIIFSFALVGLLMLAVSSIQLLPSLSLLANSRRGVEGLPFNETTSWSFHPLQLLDWVVPEFFGSATGTPTLWMMVLANRNVPYYVSSFVGFVPLLLAFVGVMTGRDRRMKFAGAGAVALLVLAFGRFAPVFALAYLIFPPLALVRFPVKLLVPMLLLVAVLAGAGFDAMRLRDGLPDDRRKKLAGWLAGLAGALTLLWLLTFIAPGWIDSAAAWILLRTNAMFVRTPAGELNAEQTRWAVEYFVKMLQIHLPGLAGFALGGTLWVWALKNRPAWAIRAVPAAFLLSIGQLAWVNYSANPTVQKSFFSYRPPVLDHLALNGKPYRFAFVFREAVTQPTAPDVQGFVNFESIPEARDLPPAAQIPFRDRLILARASMLLDAEGVMNIDVERSFPAYLNDFWVFALKGLSDPAQAACLLGRTNVRYEILRQRMNSPVEREVAPIANGSPDPHYLYENLCAMPRAYAVGKANMASSYLDALSHLSDPTFEARGEAFIARAEIVPATAGAPGSAGEVEILNYGPNEVVLRAAMDRPGYVMLLDRFDPNWQATVDGRAVAIYRANQLFRAVYCEAGQHEIRFFYVQWGLKAGFAISLGALLLLAALYFKR
jgi:hypothetical protein